MSAATRALMGAIFVLGAGNAIAQTGNAPETQYVIEQLVVSVNAAPDGSGDRVDQIKSGDRVDVLERQGEQSRVKLASGQEGWVRSSYLSTTPPLREQLKTRTDELEKLRAEKTKLEAELASAKKAATTAAANAASAATAAPPPTAASSPPPAANDPSAAPPSGGPSSGTSAGDAAPPPANPPMFASDGMMPSRPSWLVAITVSGLTLIGGFVLGWRVLDKRIRAKYGGLRIY
jgi:SH3-like domain-containing protein